MNIIIDLIVIAIIALCVLISAKHGFVKTAVEVAGFILAVIITFTISTPLAEVTYDKIIEPSVVSAVSEAVQNAGNTLEDSAIDALPEFVTKNAEKFDITITDFTDKVSQDLSNGAETAVKNASQDTIKPIISKVLGLVYSIVILLVLLIVVKVLSRIINKMFSFSIIGKVNRILGGVIGLPKGLIFAVLFCMIISLLVSLYGGFLIFTSENIASTVVFKFFAQIIPL